MPIRRMPWTPFLWLCALGGLAILSSTMSKNPALPLFVKSLGAPQWARGFIAAASTVTGILVSVPAGILSDVWGRKRVILLSMFVFASAPFLYLLVRDPWQLVMVRVYHGLATAILGPVARATVADTFEQGRGERMAWYSSATMVGRFLAPTVGGLLILGDSFTWVWLGCGLAGVLALLSATRLPGAPRLPATRAARPAAERRTLGSAWGTARTELRLLATNRDILVTGGMDAALYFAFGAVEFFLPLCLKDLGYAPALIGPLFTMQIVVTALTKPWMGRLSDRQGRTPLIVAGLLLAAFAVLALPWAGNASSAELPLGWLPGNWPSLGTFINWFLVALLLAFFGLSVAVITASTSALVSDLSRASAYGASLGVLSSVMDVGQASGPPLVGLVITIWGYPLGFALICAVLLAAALLFATHFRPPRPAETVATEEALRAR